jgi:protein involved in polysaccharide export with SLBB domain
MSGIPGVRQGPASRSSAPRSAVGALGLEVSLGSFSQNQFINREFSHRAFQPAVLALQFLEALRLIDLEPAVFVAPAIIGLFGNAESTADLRHGLSLPQPQVYRIGSNDIIRIQVYGEDDLTVERKVGGDGKIDVPLLGLIRATGRTTEELQIDLTGRLSAGYLKQPQVTVTITRHRNFYVSGEVKAAGGYPYEEGLTVQKAITMAGGFTDKASKIDLRVERPRDRELEILEAGAGSFVLPDDLIIVATAQRFYVNGEVKKPGDYGYERGLTLHMAITMAGGFTDKASKTPKVLRKVNGQERTVELALDAPVLPDDIIVVAQRFF